MAAKLNYNLNLKQTAKLIATNGHLKTYLVRGEPGIGKSAMLKMMALMFPNHTPVYVDMTQMDIGDIQIPYINQQTQTVDYFPNAMFQTNTEGSKPVLVMLDEFGKANRAVQNVCLPIMLERRVGKFKLHPDSIVFCTSNLTSDGVGDNIQAHANNRMAHITVNKPNAEEWVLWGMENGIHESVLMFVKENPHVLLSYMDDGQGTPEGNPYIYNPKNQVAAFVTPRSLEAASHALHNKDKVDDHSMFADLCGTIGARAAADMRAQIELLNDLPPFSLIVADPKNAPIPLNNKPALCLLIFSLLSRLQKDNFNAVFDYVVRLPDELQSLFVLQLVPLQSKVAFCATNARFTNWISKYSTVIA